MDMGDSEFRSYRDYAEAVKQVSKDTGIIVQQDDIVIVTDKLGRFSKCRVLSVGKKQMRLELLPK